MTNTYYVTFNHQAFSSYVLNRKRKNAHKQKNL